MHSTSLGPSSYARAIARPAISVSAPAEKRASLRTYWVTLRLADAWSDTRPLLMQHALKNRATEPRIHRLERARYLDAGVGACVLARPDIAEIVAATLGYSDACTYHLKAWCIMPNHVHAVLRMNPGGALARVIESWKTFTSKRARRILGSGGDFWESAHYERLLTSNGQIAAAVDYVLASPRRGSLMNWPWVWSDRFLDTAVDAEPMPPMPVHMAARAVHGAASL